jgi:hypothetical protein
VKCATVTLKNCSISTDLSVMSSVIADLDISQTSINRHLVVSGCTISNEVSLAGSTTGEVTRFEDNQLTEKARLDVFQYTTSRFIFYPSTTLLGNAGTKVMQPQKFGILKANDPQRLGGLSA